MVSRCLLLTFTQSSSSRVLPSLCVSALLLFLSVSPSSSRRLHSTTRGHHNLLHSFASATHSQPPQLPSAPADPPTPKLPAYPADQQPASHTAANSKTASPSIPATPDRHDPLPRQQQQQPRQQPPLLAFSQPPSVTPTATHPPTGFVSVMSKF
ncbi:vegetative cell wall protein gp1-like [Malania oleifera]|uniref:vegetative cell wall protein gp1-like n=1 Tax=Malania oleifera TaxID=397392 RepID=UPI0025AE3C7B|nr:vegetative cell wall protein gp1-like [Malania oleifera]